MRQASVKRQTRETNIALTLGLDGSGQHEIASGVGFLDHMLAGFCVHAQMDLRLSCQGDSQVDDHHSVEDIGICLGQAIKAALGDKAGIARFGDIALPMDEALVLAALDISGRGGYYGQLDIPTATVGSFDTQLVDEFFIALCRESGITLHLRQLCGRNSHHIIEAAFKAFARALRQAVSADAQLEGRIASSKGSL